MIEENRTKKSFRNGTVVAVQQILKLIIAFVVRYIFLLYLNAEYLGLGAVFTNILTVFSLAELGFSEAITVMLFRPLIDGDEEKIKTYMKCIKKVYFFAFCFVVVLGVLIVPFLSFLIGDSINIENIYLIYSLYVANSAISYLFSYKKVLLFADQNGYISYVVTMIMNVVCAVAQILVLVFTRSYLLYYLMVAISTFLENFIISYIINKRYPFLTEKNVQKMTLDDQKIIRKKMYGLIIQKVCAVICDSIDVILISIMFGTTIVGYYNNYTMVILSASSLFAFIYGVILPSVGNFIVQKSSDEVYDLFGKTNFVTFIVYSLTSIGLALLINDVILIVAHGDVSYLLDMEVVIAVVSVYYFLGIRQNIVVYKNAYGLYWESRFVPLITAILNLTLSIALGLAIGLVGIFIATIISHIIASIVIETQILFKHGIKHSPKSYYVKFILYMILMILEFGICYFVLGLIVIENIYLAILIKGVIIVAIIVLTYTVIFYKSSGFKFVIDTIKKIFRKRLSKKSF